MKYLFLFATLLSLGLLYNDLSKSDTKPEAVYEIAFMHDIHFHDLFSDFSGDGFPGLPTEYKGQNRTAAIRTMEAQLTSTRLFNENYFAFLAALNDAVQRGIKLIALPGDFSDDGQPVHVKGLVEILRRYQNEYNLKFFVTPGNHDPVRPFTIEAGEGDFLGTDGRPQPIYSANHPMCNDQSSRSLQPPDSTEPNPHSVVCSNGIINLGYQDLFNLMGDFGLKPDQNTFYYETPFTSNKNGGNPSSHKPEKFRFDQRQYEICHEGSGGQYKKAGYTHCKKVMDMSYLIEPVEGLWLLAIDANVYIPKKEENLNPERNFSGSGNAGYNKLITHKKHLLEWITDVANRAEKKDKTLIAFSHFPAVDFYNGAQPKIEQLWGKNEFQLARVPKENTSITLARSGLNFHVAGHMHMNGTSIVSDSLTGNVLTNIQVPSLAAYVPAYKIVRTTNNGANQVEVETIILKNVPQFDTLFPHYREEWEYLDSIGYEKIWDRSVLESQNYSEFTNWHIKELSRLRFLPREWPENVRAILSGMTGQDMLIASQLKSSLLFSNYKQWLETSDSDIKNITQNFTDDWNKATVKAKELARQAGFKLSDFDNWNGSDLSTDFYRLRNAGELALRDISSTRLKQYSLVASTLLESPLKISNNNEQKQFDDTFRDTFRTVFEVMHLFVDRLPGDKFRVDLENGVIYNLKENQKMRLFQENY